MNEEAARVLAWYRVGVEKRLGKDMSDEQIAERRKYIRTMLRNVPGWENITDEQVDNIRIYRFDEDWYIEDTDFYEYKF